MTGVAETTVPAPSRPAARRDIAALRVLAILGVITIHVSGLTVIDDALRDTSTWRLALVLNEISRFCVPLFVMVSGALVLRPGSPQPTGAFLRTRLRRLLPALVAWHAVYIAFKATVLDDPSGPGEVLAQLLTGRTYTGLYFFWLVLGLYLVTPALSTALARLDATGLLRVGVGLTALTCLWRSTVDLVSDTSGIDVTSTPTVFTYWVPYLGYYVLGAALVRTRVDRLRGAVALAVAALASGLTVWLASAGVPDESPTTYFAWSVALATAALFVAATGLLPPREGSPSALGRLVERMGALTLGVFASHLLVLYALQQSGVLSVTKGASRPLELAYLGVGTVLGSYALAWLLSRVPGLRRLV